jgi:hypothetical protein
VLARRAAVIAAAWVLTACRATPAGGTLELRWTVAPAGLDGLSALVLAPDWAGAGRGPERDDGWVRVPVLARQVSLPHAAGDPVAVVSATVPAGRYDRVFVDAPSVTGIAPDGARHLLVSHIEPIARGFDLRPGGTVRIDIELVVLPSSSIGDGRPEVFVKDAREIRPDAEAAGGR